MRPVSLARRSRSKAKDRICALTKQDSSALDWSEFSCAARVFATARSTIALPPRRRTQRAELIHTALHPVRADRALPESEAGLWFDPARGDQCVRLRQV